MKLTEEKNKDGELITRAVELVSIRVSRVMATYIQDFGFSAHDSMWKKVQKVLSKEEKH